MEIPSAELAEYIGDAAPDSMPGEDTAPDIPDEMRRKAAALGAVSQKKMRPKKPPSIFAVPNSIT